jgi:secondary thiamine-phosphate synthase enzyme
MIRYIEVKSRSRSEFIDITGDICSLLQKINAGNGVCHLFVMHTTAGITVNEGADPAVQRDLISFLGRLVPADPRFTHQEGNSDAHMKSSLMGCSQVILVENGKPVLGTWQAVYFCEFDGPRSRKVAVKFISAD